MSLRSIPSKELIPIILEELKSGNEFPLVVTGHSMSPTLYHLRDRVYLCSPELRKPVKYEIVLFMRENGTYIMHRIIQEQMDGSYLMNGDAQTWTEIIKPEQVLAVVKSLERKGKWISCDNKGYQRYVKFWVGIKPIRGFLMSTCNRLRKLWG